MKSKTENTENHNFFDKFLQILEQLFDSKLLKWTPKDEKFIKIYEQSGSLNWHEFYEKSFLEIAPQLNSHLNDLNVMDQIKENATHEEINKLFEDVKNLKDDKKTANQAKFKKMAPYKNIPVRILSLANRINLICVLKFGCETRDLIEKARNLDEDAFLKLVKLDSTFLTTDYARKILNRVELRNDTEFKKRLSNALKPNPNFWKIDDRRNIIALWLLSQLGYENRPYSEWSDFLVEHGFENYIDPQTVAKAVKRHKISKKYPSRSKK